jgi:carboxylate-amine ligase
MIDFGKSIELPTRRLIGELLDLVAEEVDELGTAAYLEPIQSILTEGTSADRQLRVFDETDGDLNAVVDHLIAETQIGL